MITESVFWFDPKKVVEPKSVEDPKTVEAPKLVDDPKIVEPKPAKPEYKLESNPLKPP